MPKGFVIRNGALYKKPNNPNKIVLILDKVESQHLVEALFNNTHRLYREFDNAKRQHYKDVWEQRLDINQILLRKVQGLKFAGLIKAKKRA